MPTRLERYERICRALAAELAAELATVGLTSPGSLVSRYTSCGKPELSLPSQDAATPRPLLPVEPGDRGQDHQPPSQRSRGAALPGLDRQPPSHRTAHRPDGADLSSRSRAALASSSRQEPPPDSEVLTARSGGSNAHREVRNVSEADPVSGRKEPSNGITAGELMARLEADEDYQARRRILEEGLRRGSVNGMLMRSPSSTTWRPLESR